MNPGPEVNPDPRRSLPAVERLAARLREECPDLPPWAAAEGARRVLAAERERLSAAPDGSGATAAPPEALLARAAEAAEALAAVRPGRVVNATGVVLHTNLGRAPLAPGAAAAAAAAGAAYSDLELDLDSGRRGGRLGSVAEKLRLLTGAEGALAVNNNAAAVLLALDTLARGREVVVSRGELVEIGGSFRIPEIVERAGVRLVEVGTTNRTHLRDYERAIGADTAALLKVHRSNFEQRGFVAEVGLPELAALARERGLPLVEDLGSGTVVDLAAAGFPEESVAPRRLEKGADLVLFSGDKLLGGPQAGIALGRADLVAAMAGNPLARALRLDKMSLAALDWTLRALADGRGERELPALRQLLAPPEELERRARALARRVAAVAGGAGVAAAPDRAAVGGGSLPGTELPTWVVAVDPPAGASDLAARLRRAAVPVVCRVREGRLLVDVRTLLDGDEEIVERALKEALSAAPV